MSRSLSVWWDGAIAGTLRVDKHGTMTFVYAPEWLADRSRAALSFSLPKRAEPFTQRECRPFFAGLLPEEAPRRAIAHALHISRANDFRLLEALGGDVAGALSLWPEGTAPPAQKSTKAVEPLDDQALAQILEKLPRRPLLAGEEGLRLSLAGAQPKLPVVLVAGRVALPAPGQPTTHIVKPPVSAFEALTENETLMMRLASAIGLRVANVEPRQAAGRPFLLVTRYDRRVEASGRTTRLHQEDFCQALGIAPEQKYADEGGPTFKSSFELLRRASTRPAIETLALLDAAIFNVLAGNSDAHGKNFSLLYDGDAVSLAPLYDLVCTVAYPDLSPQFAMRIGKSKGLEDLSEKAWSTFAADIGIAVPYVRRRVRELADAVHGRVSQVAVELEATGLGRQALTQYASLISARAARLRQQ